jgi:hypothetical protein
VALREGEISRGQEKIFEDGGHTHSLVHGNDCRGLSILELTKYYTLCEVDCMNCSSIKLF